MKLKKLLPLVGAIGATVVAAPIVAVSCSNPFNPNPDPGPDPGPEPEPVETTIWMNAMQQGMFSAENVTVSSGTMYEFRINSISLVSSLGYTAVLAGNNGASFADFKYSSCYCEVNSSTTINPSSIQTQTGAIAFGDPTSLQKYFSDGDSVCMYVKFNFSLSNATFVATFA